MRFVIAVVLAAGAFVLGSLGYRHLPVEQDAGVGVLLVAGLFGVVAGAVHATQEVRSGSSAGKSAARGAGFAALIVVLAMVPVVAFLAYCFSPLNPDAPCLR